jgi:tetratricopeptide (TPR) repeat protein
MDEREKRYLDLISQFPDSPLGHFSLAKYYLEVRRFAEALAPLEHCVAQDGEWGAALLALGDVYAGLGDHAKAVATLARAKATSLARRDASFLEDVEDRLSELREAGDLDSGPSSAGSS